MTDAHCHLISGETRHFLCSPFSGEVSGEDVAFYGAHPWFLGDYNLSALRERLAQNPHSGVGEIGLDRLKEKNISVEMREKFRAQLSVAAEFSRPVVLHGAKCWGEVVKECFAFKGLIPAMLFHGFSRSDGLIPDMIALNGYISIGPSLLNDHAVNYRSLAKKIPIERVLVESDRTTETADIPSVQEVAKKLAELRGMALAELSVILEQNATAFIDLLKGKVKD